MLALVVAMGIGRFVYTPILPMMIEEIGLSASQAGVIASSNFAGYLLGAVIAATSLLKGSRRVWMLAALSASAVTTILMAWTDGYLQFLLLRFAAGVFSAWVLVFASALIIGQLVAAGRARLSALHFAGVGAGIIAASLLTAVAAHTAGGWRGAWLYNGAFALILAGCVACLVDESGETAMSAKTRGDGHRTIIWLLAAYGLFGFGYVITATFIIQIVRALNYSLAIETWIWVLVGAAAVLSVWFWDNIANRVGNCRAFAMACICESIGVAASVLLANIAGLVFASLLLGGTFMGITALGLAEAHNRCKGDLRHALAMMTAVFGIGQIAGPVAAGYMHDISGSFLLPSLLASGALLAAAMLVHIRS